VLINEGIKSLGLYIFGGPITPLFGGAFGELAGGSNEALRDNAQGRQHLS
jgi:hypothetical protein